MSFSLKPHQLVAHWVPGFVLLLVIWVVHPSVRSGMERLLPGDLQRGFVIVVLAFVAGQLIDCLRNGLFESWRDKRQEVNWDFFFTGQEERVERLDRWFFEYYVFDFNLAVPTLYFAVWRLFQGHWVQSLGALAAAAILVRDFWSLRGEIAKHTKSSDVPATGEAGPSPK